jgi:arsenical pump membrane protein
VTEDRRSRAARSGAWAPKIRRALSAHPLSPLAGLDPLDWIRIALLIAGVVFVAAGALPVPDAVASMERILPLLVFLGSVLVLAELTAVAQVFEVIAARIAIAGRGNYVALFLLCVTFASLTTAALNLDTTAVLLTPVMLATARRSGIASLPLAMATVWLANTASLLLPVSNLTNLLAANRVALAPVAFAARMALPEVASVAATMCFLWLFYWRRGRRGADRYEPPPPFLPRDPVLFGVAAAACAVFVAGVVAGVPLQFAAPACAAAVVVAFVFRARQALRPGIIPWRLLVFVVGLFLVVPTVGRHGLDVALAGLIGTAGDGPGVLRAAGAGALLSNLLNNLPAYVAGESVIPLVNHQQLLGLLLGTNVGPIVTPWASLATLLWYERCRADGLRIEWRRFMLTGLVTAVGTLAACTAMLVATAGLGR